MAGSLGNIGTAHVTVELDFQQAFRDAQQAEDRFDPVELKVGLDQSQVNREVGRTLDAATTSAGPIEPRVAVDGSQATNAVRTALRNAAVAAGPVEARVGVDQSQANREVGTAVRTAGLKAGAIPVRLDRRSLATANQQITKGFGGSFSKVGALLTAALAPALGGAVVFQQLRAGAEDAKTLDASLVSLRNAIKAAGSSSGVTEAQVKRLASNFEDLSSISEESIISSIGGLTRFGVATKANLPDITKLFLDTAVGMRQVNEQGDVSPAFQAKFAAALNDPVKGLALLKKAGEKVTAQQKDYVKGLVKAGKTGEATAFITEKLSKRFNDSAKDLGEGVGGQLRLATDAFEDARRDLATKVLPSIAPIVKSIGTDLAKAINDNQAAIAQFITNMIKGAGAVLKFVTSNKDFLGTMKGIGLAIAGVVSGIAAAAKTFAAAFNFGQGEKSASSLGETMTNVGRAIGAAAKAIGNFKPFIIAAIAPMLLLVGAVRLAWRFVKFLVGVVKMAIDQFPGLKDAFKAIPGIASGVVERVKGFIDGVVAVFQSAKDRIGEFANSIAGFLKKLLTPIQKVRDGIQGIIDAAKGLPGAEAGIGAAKAAVDGVGDAADSNKGKIAALVLAPPPLKIFAIANAVRGVGKDADKTKEKLQQGFAGNLFDNLNQQVTNSRTNIGGFGAFYAGEINEAATASEQATPRVSKLFAGLQQGIRTALEKAIGLGERLAKTAGSVLKAVGQGIRAAFRAKQLAAARSAIANISGVFRRFRDNLVMLVPFVLITGVAIQALTVRVRMLTQAFRLMLNGLLVAVRVVRVQLVAAFVFAIARIRQVINGASLYRAGTNLMGTFLSGLQDGFQRVQTFIRGIATWIEANKGPISKDKKLLYPAGQAIMGGFDRGLRRRWSPVQTWVKDIGGFFKGIVPSSTFDGVFDNILAGGGQGIKDLNKVLANSLGIPVEFLTSGPLGFLHPTSGWADTLSQGRLMEKVLGLTMGSGLRFQDTVAGPNVSQHVLGQAIDWGTAANSFAALNRLATITSKMHHVFKQVIWQNRDWTNGGYIGNHMDHVHTGWQPRAAGGGVSKGRAYQWNERGREMFIPQQNGYVMNASNTKELIRAMKAAGGSSSTNTKNAEIHVHSNAADPRAVGAQVMSNLGMVFSRA